MLSCFSSRCSFCCWDCGFASRSHNKNLVHPSFMANGEGIEMGKGQGQGERVRGSSCVDSRTSQLVAPRCIYITFLSEFISFNCCCLTPTPSSAPLVASLAARPHCAAVGIVGFENNAPSPCLALPRLDAVPRWLVRQTADTRQAHT